MAKCDQIILAGCAGGTEWWHWQWLAWCSSCSSSGIDWERERDSQHVGIIHLSGRGALLVSYGVWVIIGKQPCCMSGPACFPTVLNTSGRCSFSTTGSLRSGSLVAEEDDGVGLWPHIIVAGIQSQWPHSGFLPDGSFAVIRNRRTQSFPDCVCIQGLSSVGFWRPL